MDKVQLLYHEETGTYWSNDKDWRKRWENESISYGNVTMDTNNIFIVKKSMNKDGYELVKYTEGTPFKSSNKHKN